MTITISSASSLFCHSISFLSLSSHFQLSLISKYHAHIYLISTLMEFAASFYNTRHKVRFQLLLLLLSRYIVLLSCVQASILNGSSKIYISDKGQVSKILLILLHFKFLKHNNLLLREL